MTLLVKIKESLKKIDNHQYYQEIDSNNRILFLIQYEDEEKTVERSIYIVLQGSSQSLRKYYNWRI